MACCFRRADWSRLRQPVTLLPNSHYEFSAMVKLLNQSDFVLGETVDMIWNYEGTLLDSRRIKFT